MRDQAQTRPKKNRPEIASSDWNFKTKPASAARLVGQLSVKVDQNPQS